MIPPDDKQESANDIVPLIVSDSKIMMIDDEELNMEVLRVHLESEGYRRFVSLSDSTRAMEAIRHEKPAVLLLDLVMPEVSGFEILADIRADVSLRHLPIIVLTSANDGETKLKALKLGATDFLAKPIDPSELALRMRNTLAAVAWQRRTSEIDPLTSLPNRLWFSQMLRRRQEQVCDGHSSSALILININKFKSINDSLGPMHGDEVLSSFCDRLLHSFRGGREQPWYSSEYPCMQSATLARLEGDRFAVHVPSCETRGYEETFSVTIDSLVKSLHCPFYIDGQPIYVTVSIGIAMLNDRTPSVEALINNAETAMRYSQTNHDAQFALYSDEMDAGARLLLNIQNGLHTAIENGEIFLLFQPKIDVKTNTITGAEALVRWKHPEYGLISPVNFIPLAENSGVIVSIGEWVLRESCKQAYRWQQSGFKDFRIAVNVSIRQLYETEFVSIVEAALQDSGLPAKSLILELTENMIMDNADTNVVKLKALKALGIGLSIDDFGTGYSSLSYLQRFPIDQLKIDRSFIMEIDSVSSPRPIVKAVISLAHDLGMNVVAEGVETEAQLKHIRELKCDEYQGFLCSKPVPASVLLSHLNEELRKPA